MKTKVRIALLGAFLVSATWTTPADGQSIRGAGAHRRLSKVLMAIPSLTADQKARVLGLANTGRLKSAPFREQQSNARKAMASLWAADTVDQAAVARKQAELDGVAAKITALWTEVFLQLHDVLTAPQRAWLASRGSGVYGAYAGPDTGQGCPCSEE
jgi:Spy/CpxP family protein refolding chaperone